MTEGAEQGEQSRVVFRIRWWKDGFVIMIKRNFACHLMMGVFSRVCSGVLWGRGGLQCRILGGVIVYFFG